MPLESPIVGGSGGGGGSLPQPLDTTDSPTFAGLTLTSFSGIVRAASGVLSAGWYTAEQTNPATIGFVRASNATTIVAARNSTNTGDWTILSTTTKIVLGAASGPAISVLSGANITFGDAGTFVTVNVNGITLEGNDSTALYGGDNSGNPYKLVSAIDQTIWLGENIGSVVANCADSWPFIVANNGVNTCSIVFDGGESFATFDSGYPATVKIADNATGSGANLSLMAGSSGGSNGDGGDLALVAGEKNGSGAHGDLVGRAGGQERLRLSYGKSAWQRFGPLWILEIDLSLIANSGASSEITVANPADHFVISALWTMRLSTGITGGTSTITGGISSGGTEVIASTVWNSGTGANTTVQGGPTDADSKVGSTYLLGWDGYKFTSATTLYFKAAASGSNVTAGVATIKMFGREF